MKRFVIEIDKDGELAEQWEAVGTLHLSLVRIIEQLGFDPADASVADCTLGLVVKTDEARLCAILGALSDSNFHGEQGEKRKPRKARIPRKKEKEATEGEAGLGELAAHTAGEL